MLVDVLVYNGGVVYEEIFQLFFDEEGFVVDIFYNKIDVIVDLCKCFEWIEVMVQVIQVLLCFGIECGLVGFNWGDVCVVIILFNLIWFILVCCGLY